MTPGAQRAVDVFDATITLCPNWRRAARKICWVAEAHQENRSNA
eukprot:CAMPEP_0194382518 /NCGR_PEP_ID=MMETSP0174-20130528/61241_1 /TAXON_ID=216777 /ORGANISM="Proboscia alata, Strain PI-D3" /LENGTH=43 /DNA_ID= /DNA_START= /DNA_END= /DNA_ORIENTATION=